MRIYFLNFLFLLSTNLCFSQVIIEGKVKSKMGNLSDVSITINNKGSNNIIAFCFSDYNGKFQTKNSLNLDSVNIVFSIVGYKTIDSIVANKSQTIEVTLEEFATELPTVIIKEKKEALTKKSDTVSYNVSQFESKQDRVIADVIAKLPGVEINNETGQITYNGKPIAHYYIDGLDLLGGNYNIANKNIPVDFVDQVQMIKHDKNIKILDSIKTSKDPAINIKLKKSAKNKFIGTAKNGIGATPILFDNSITGMMFRNKLQFISAYKNNNTGLMLANELTNNSIISRGSIDNGEKNLKEGVLSLIGPNTPPISSKRYSFNNSNIAYINILKVLPNTAQVKGNFSYINDFFTYDNEISTTYNVDNNTINFNEKAKGYTNTNKASGSIFYTVNNRKKYVNNNIVFDVEFINKKSNLFNITDINQTLKNPFYVFKNELNIFFPYKKLLLTLNSKTNFSKMPQQQRVSPGQFLAITNLSLPYDEIRQGVTVNNFNTDNNLSFIYKKRRWLQEIKFGAELVHKTFTSQTSKWNNQILTNLNDSFKNVTNWNSLRTYAENIITYTKGEKSVDFILPLEFNANKTSNKNDLANNKRNNFFFNPSVGFYLPLSQKFSLGADVSFGSNINGSISQITDGLVFINYRTINKNENILPLQKMKSASANLSFKSPLAAIYSSVSFSYNKINKNIIYSQNFNNYFVSSTALYLDNYQENYRLNVTFSKYFLPIKLSLNVDGGTSLSTNQLLLQNKMVNSKAKSLTAGLKMTYSKLKWLSLNTTNNLSLSNNLIEEYNNSFNNYSFIQNTTAYFFITKTTTFSLNNEIYRFGNDNIDQQYYFLDFTFSKKIKKNDFDLVFSNITNNKNFITISNSQYSSQVSNYTIRPANILVKYSYRF